MEKKKRQLILESNGCFNIFFHVRIIINQFLSSSILPTADSFLASCLKLNLREVIVSTPSSQWRTHCEAVAARCAAAYIHYT